MPLEQPDEKRTRIPYRPTILTSCACTFSSIVFGFTNLLPLNSSTPLAHEQRRCKSLICRFCSLPSFHTNKNVLSSILRNSLKKSSFFCAAKLLKSASVSFIKLLTADVSKSKMDFPASPQEDKF